MDSPVIGAGPRVAHLNWVQLAAGETERLLVCDMDSGVVQAAAVTREEIRFEPIATLNNPARAEVCDLDRDGTLDLLIADLGSFLPADHNLGRVIWLRGRPESPATYETVVLAEGMGRVCDVQPADFDGDGDTDLVVAEFGWRKTGRLVMLENTSGPGETLQFKLHVIDPRHGPIHVPVVDLNADQRPDILVLFAQEHEKVEAFLNEGPWQFRAQRLFEADRPTFGSSGIRLADLEGDGDIDVLYTNGDMFDNVHLRPSTACGGWRIVARVAGSTTN